MHTSTVQTNQKKKLNTLILDDCEIDRMILQRQLYELEDYEITTFLAENFDVALKVYNENKIDLIFVDYWLNGETSLDFLKEMKGRLFNIPMVLYSGVTKKVVRQSGFSAGAGAYLSKNGLNPTNIVSAIEAAQNACDIEDGLSDLLRSITQDKRKSQASLMNLSSIVSIFLNEIEQQIPEADRSAPNFQAAIQQIRECCSSIDARKT